MHGLSAWFTKNSVAANLLMAVILAGGFLTLNTIRIEGFPALPANAVTIYTGYPGADAFQVDQGISRKIETALKGMPGIKKLSSLSFEGYSQIHVKKTSRFNMDRFQNEIKTRVDQIADFPQMTRRPIVMRDEFNVDALLVQVYGETDTEALQKTARTVKQALISHPRIAKIDVFGMTPYEIRIEADEKKLTAYGITLTDLSAAINQASFDYITGTLDRDSGKLIVKADTRAFDLEAFRRIPVKTLPSGALITLEDTARIVDGFARTQIQARFQGKVSVGMLVYTTQQGDLIQVSRAAHQIVSDLSKQLPKNIKVDIWGESSIYMNARLNLLKTNALQGLAIVFILLALFLNLRLAFWVAAGIPVSIAGAFIIMGPRFLNYSLNDVTTFGLIIVLGILVDDAVVVGESVFEARQHNSDPVTGTIAGVSKVSTATVFGCFTTIAAFYPPLLIDNEIGKLFAGFSTVVIISLLASLVESKLILPAHLSHIRMNTRNRPNFLAGIWSGIQRKASAALESVKERIYRPLLKTALYHRYSFFIGFVLFSVLTIGMAGQGIIKTVFFPEVPGQIIIVNMDMISGSPLNLTIENMKKLEQAALAVNRQIMAETGTDRPPIIHLLSALSDKETVEIYAELEPEKTRTVETLETLNLWRDKAGVLEGVHKLSFSGSFDTSGGFEIELSTPDTALLKPASDELITHIRQIKGVKNTFSDLAPGSPMLHLKLKPEARHLGLTDLDLARFVGDSFGGLEAQTFIKQSEEVRVKVILNESKRRYISDLLSSRMMLPSGESVPLAQIATLENRPAPSGIFRKNGLRVATIEADLDKSVISPAELFDRIKKEILPVLSRQYPGLSVRGTGELDEIEKMEKGLKNAFIMILICIFVLIAIPLKSYFQPLVIMSVIPFALVGAIFGHFVMDLPLSVLSFLGVLGACGVVVNDSLLMLTRFNALRKKGIAFNDALIQAGTSRFRAIFLTTATTVGGLAPLLFETSEQAQYLIPAAVSLAFGELVATPFTLLLIPMLLAAGKDIRQTVKLFFTGRDQSAVDKQKSCENQPHPGKGVPARRLAQGQDA